MYSLLLSLGLLNKQEARMSDMTLSFTCERKYPVAPTVSDPSVPVLLKVRVLTPVTVIKKDPAAIPVKG
jgi:hypothetical protein